MCKFGPVRICKDLQEFEASDAFLRWTLVKPGDPILNQSAFLPNALPQAF
jgi:hypothetical protein